MFFGSANLFNVFLIPPNYDITGKSNMATNMAVGPSITLIRFIVILERSFWCVFQSTVLLIMAFVRAEREGEGYYTYSDFQVKSIIKRKHQVEVTNPSMDIQDDVIIDGCAIGPTLCAPMAQQRTQLPRTHIIFDLYNRTRASRMQHARFHGNTN